MMKNNKYDTEKAGNRFQFGPRFEFGTQTPAAILGKPFIMNL